MVLCGNFLLCPTNLGIRDQVVSDLYFCKYFFKLWRKRLHTKTKRILWDKGVQGSQRTCYGFSLKNSLVTQRINNWRQPQKEKFKFHRFLLKELLLPLKRNKLSSYSLRSHTKTTFLVSFLWDYVWLLSYKPRRCNVALLQRRMPSTDGIEKERVYYLKLFSKFIWFCKSLIT